MTTQEIRKSYQEFFQERTHAAIPRASLVPDNDATTLFTGSGMQPLIPYLLGQSHPGGTRLVNSQPCLRAQDIEDVGDNRHTTFFEMLGNWSLGDYFKQEQIEWFFTYLVDVVGLDPSKLYVTCYIGDQENDIPRDDESAEIWQRLFRSKDIEAKIVEVGSQEDGDQRGIQPGERIFFYDDGENWWSRGGGLDATPMGDPCGPDSEVFYDFGAQNHDPAYGHAHPASDSGRFMEIGNQVFMQYLRTDSGFEPLENKNVDFGGGLERIAAAAIDSPDIFRISLLWPIIESLEKLSGAQYDSHTESMRVIADHLRAATFLAADGVLPSNKEQGYVARRLLRRAIMKAFHLGIEQNFLPEIVPVVVELYAPDYPEVSGSRKEIIEALIKEEKTFRQTLQKGLGELRKYIRHHQDESAVPVVVPGEVVFRLYDTYGYPLELTQEILAMEEGAVLAEDWREAFDAEMAEQRRRSQTAAKGQFKGGLGGESLQHKQYHTATHLMYESLRQVLGEHVIQRGSNITEERLRFDFTHPEKVTPEQLQEVEAMVNEQIERDLVITWEEHPTDYALRELKPLGHFGDRYGDVVKIYRMQAEDAAEPFSYEICGGPHVERTSDLSQGGKKFRIVKEEASSSGVRRIKAVLE